VPIPLSSLCDALSQCGKELPWSSLPFALKVNYLNGGGLRRIRKKGKKTMKRIKFNII